MTAADGRPELSVVVALISGRPEDLERCLRALADQREAPALEVLVPYDEAARGVAAVAERFPDVRFLPAPELDTAAARAGASREHHDTLRTLGLRAARGAAVALTEDHAVASPGWAAALVRFLAAHPDVAAVGGAVECGAVDGGEPRLLNRAVHLCDFGRYQNPLSAGPAAYVSDSNVAYRTEALEAVRAAWADDYHETLVHAALTAAGHELWLSPDPVVHQVRSSLRWRGALRERFVWGRSFAGTRTRELSAARRAVYAALSAALPLVLTWRVLQGARARGRADGPFFAALPLVLLLHGFWALGELAGYLTGDPGRA